MNFEIAFEIVKERKTEMNFETAFEIMKLAPTNDVEISFFGRTKEFGAYDLRTRWACKLNELPFWVSRFDVNQVDITAYQSELFIFLEPDQVNRYWEQIEALS